MYEKGSEDGVTQVASKGIKIPYGRLLYVYASYKSIRRYTMKRLGIVGLFGLCIVTVVFCCSPSLAFDNVKFYLEAEAGCTFVNLDSGGFNTAGSFPNTGDDWDTIVVPGAHVGAELFRFLRADLGFNYRGNLDFTTNSFAPPVPTYFYDTDVDTYTLMFSLYLEPFHYKKWTPYVGTGVGSTWMKITTDDTAVQGSGHDTSFSWQAEAGIQYELTKHFTLRLGYRYIDMGSFDIPLWDGAAGNFEGDLAAHEILFGVRYRF
jgi:opacity protein-like surface antigen